MDDNVVEFTGEWQGADENAPAPTDEEIEAAMAELMDKVDFERLTEIISSSLEYLTIRAIADGGYYILTDDGSAMALFAANDDVKKVLDVMPENFKCMNDEEPTEEFITNADPGDEQDEPTA